MTRPSRWWAAGLVGGAVLVLAGNGNGRRAIGVSSAHAAAVSCVGDCDHNAVVTGGEILKTLSISLGTTARPHAAGPRQSVTGR